MAKEYRKLGKGKDMKETWIKQRSERLDTLLAHATAHSQYEKSQRQEQIGVDKAVTESRIARLAAFSSCLFSLRMIISVIQHSSAASGGRLG